MLLKVSFWNTQQLMEVKREMQPIVRRNKNKSNATDAYKAFGPQDTKQTVKLQVSCNTTLCGSLCLVLIAVTGQLLCHIKLHAYTSA